MISIRRRAGLWVWVGLTCTLTLAGRVGAQARPTTRADSVKKLRAWTDSVLKEVRFFQDSVAVATSGSWDIDGEFKGADGKYFKMTGYFAYVASTSASKDGGDHAVISMFLEPLAGGPPHWLGSRLNCKWASGSTRCYATSGASILLDLNVLLKGTPHRGERLEAEISEPDSKRGDTLRWTGRTSPRGKFSLIPFDI